MIERFAAWIHRFIVCCSVLGVVNACKVQMLSRLRTKELSVLLPRGRRFWFRGRLDKGVLSHFYTEGYHIAGTPEQPIRRILDCGANIGDETARFLVHQPHATIVAVEAARTNFALLQRNFASCPQVRLYYGAVWPREERLKMVAGNTPEEFHAEPAPTSVAEVPIWTIPKLMEELRWDNVDILKIDIEGAEYGLFEAGFEAWINKVNAVIFEAADNPASAQLVFRAFDDRPFDAFVCGENLVLIRKHLPWKLKKIVGFDLHARSGCLRATELNHTSSHSLTVQALQKGTNV